MYQVCMYVFAIVCTIYRRYNIVTTVSVQYCYIFMEIIIPCKQTILVYLQ